MPLQKIVFKPGVNRENTRYTNEGGWYDVNKVRFRQGTPEKIGGWTRLSAYTFLGVCRSLWNWVTLGGQNLIGVGTNLKFYIEQGGQYNDVTPIAATRTLTGAFRAAYSTLSATITATDTSLTVVSGTNFSSVGGVILIGTEKIFYATRSSNTLSGLIRGYDGTTAAVHTATAGVGSYTVVVTDSSHGQITGNFVTYSGSGITSLGGNITAAILTGEYQLTVAGTNTYTITTSAAATAADTGTGGTAIAQYQVPVGPSYAVPLNGWGAGTWGTGTWGVGTSSSSSIRVWYQQNFGQNLVYGYRKGPMYYWNADIGATAIGNTVTITVASPAVVSSTKNLPNGTAVQFESTGALPTGLSVGTVYYVVNTSGTSFNVAATYNGTAINTSGTTSGISSISIRGIPVSSLAGASSVPTQVGTILISDASRFTLAFGSNTLGTTTYDPMLIRWSDQESVVEWYPQITNQAGFIRLSHGSEIRAVAQTRQEIVVLTDSSVYSLQYIGSPYVWSSQILGDNISIAGFNTLIVASGVTYWMGVDKFYKYDGRVQTLRCDLRQYIYEDINLDQQEQFFSGTSEGFSEVWWFYCSSGSIAIDKYVVYNYQEDVWYYGTLARTAWLDSGTINNPIAATYLNNIVLHESGVDDNSTGTPVAIDSYITSSEFDIGDGNNFGFIWRLLPDITFRGSSASNPQVTMTMLPLQNSGSGYNNPRSEGGVDYGAVTQTVPGTSVVVEQFTGQINVRVRGRQMSFKVQSTDLGNQWQLGSPRIDIRPDGRR